MDKVLHDLGGLLLSALPTFFLVILLHFYLKYVYFRPLGRVLAERYEATEGARKLAEQTVAQATQKAAEYEESLRQARAEIYREQEQYRQKLRQEQDEGVRAARASAEASVKAASARLAAELESAKQSLAAQTGTLADEIVRTILERRPA